MSQKDALCQHLRCVGLPSKEASRLSSLFCKWRDCNGPEFVVERLKGLLTSLRTRLDKGGYHLPPNWATKRNRKGQKILRDGVLHRLLSSNSPSEYQRAIAVFKSYTIFSITPRANEKSARPTPRQKAKFDLAVMGDISYSQDFIDSVNIDPKGLPLSFIKIDPTPLRYWAPSSKTSPMFCSRKLIWNKNRARIVEPVLNFFDDVSSLLGSEFSNLGIDWSTEDKSRLDVNRLSNYARTYVFTKHPSILVLDKRWNDLWVKYQEDVSLCITGHTHLLPYNFGSFYDCPLGTLSYIQEPGCKLRSVANPFLVLQALGEPLKQKLGEYFKLIPSIYSTDHQMGREKIQSWLADKYTVYSFDASSFTDRFPLKFQLKVLRTYAEKLGISPFDLEVFELASSGRYIDNTFRRNITWTQGQPQGFGPSFNVANLSHFALLKSICDNNRIDYDCFAIVGDDIAIRDATVASEYQKAMNLLGVEINISKSIISSNVAEFCGKLITSEVIYPTIKIKNEELTADRYVKLLEYYGSYAWTRLSLSERIRASKAILPHSLGGISFKSYDKTFVLDDQAVRSAIVKKGVDELTENISPKFTTLVQKQLNRLKEFDSMWSCNTQGIAKEVELWMYDDNFELLELGFSSLPVKVDRNLLSVSTYKVTRNCYEALYVYPTLTDLRDPARYKKKGVELPSWMVNFTTSFFSVPVHTNISDIITEQGYVMESYKEMFLKNIIPYSTMCQGMQPKSQGESNVANNTKQSEPSYSSRESKYFISRGPTSQRDER